jgi:hypothetical protein
VGESTINFLSNEDTGKHACFGLAPRFFISIYQKRRATTLRGGRRLSGMIFHRGRNSHRSSLGMRTESYSREKKLHKEFLVKPQSSWKTRYQPFVS